MNLDAMFSKDVQLFVDATARLKPCPHCGKPARMTWFGCCSFQVRCLDHRHCGAMMTQDLKSSKATSSTARSLIKRWNRRSA